MPHFPVLDRGSRRCTARPAGNRTTSEQGSALVEGAFVLTIVLLLVFGMIQFSYVVFGYNTIVYAARAGTRYAAVHGSSSPSPCSAAAVQTQVLNQLPGVPASAVTVTTTWTPDNKPGSTVRVTVSANFSPMASLVMKQGVTLSSSSQMIILQ
ncbi:MAG: TadE family protein [Bryobacteraceae bacterium]